MICHWGGDQRTARELASEALSLAYEEADPALIGPAHEAMGRTGWFQGRFREAKEHYEALLASGYDATRDTDVRLLAGMELVSDAHGMIGIVLWKLGYPDQAVRWSREGVALARKGQNPVSLAYVLQYETWVHLYRRDTAGARPLIDQLEPAAVQAGVLDLWWGNIQATEAWCLLREGRNDEAISTLRDAWADLRSKGLGATDNWCANILADALRAGGQPEEGLHVLDKTREESIAVGEGIYAAETPRIRGELLLALPEPKPEEAEAAFREAIETARAQEARSFELQATISLARLLRDTGRSEEAREMLAEIHGWFTEGFDTADLKEAKELLEELGGVGSS